MKTWRERGVEARARGYFTMGDAGIWRHTAFCPAAEAVRPYCEFGLTRIRGLMMANIPPGWEAVWELGDQIGIAISHADFDEFDRLLDEIEDRALQLKRESR